MVGCAKLNILKSNVSNKLARNGWLKQIVSVCMISMVLLSCPSCNAKSPVRETQEDGLRVLFIGNSLTYFNDLPVMLHRMLQYAEIPVARIESVAFANFGLQDHWVNGPARTEIANDDWEVVVLQQGPSATEGRPSLLEYSRRFGEEIAAAGAQTALYMVWPAASRFFDSDGVSDSYKTAADSVDGLLFPGGEAWRAAWRMDAELALYGPDNFHPSRLGSYLVALVMFEQLAQRDPHDLPAVILTADEDINISEELAKLLQDAAVEANAQFARVGRRTNNSKWE